MQMNRLFEIIYLLMDREALTAAQLAQHFEVSIRTIYRDIDVLSMSGIPVYTSRGRAGGIHLMKQFVLNKSLLSKQEQNEILAGLQGLRAIRTPDVERILNKLSALFGNNRNDWIEVDFSKWGSGNEERLKFSTLQAAILENRVVTFGYFNFRGEKSKRTVEPHKLLFKERNWYLYGFCRTKQEYRTFKITRMKNITLCNETFVRPLTGILIEGVDQPCQGPMLTVKLKVDASLACRVYDEFSEAQIEKKEDGSYIVTTDFPDSDWIYGYILSFGNAAKVLEPPNVRQKVIQRLYLILNQYL